MRRYDREVYYFEEEEITKLLIGRTVSVINDDTLRLDNGVELEIVPNEGCGGCSSGWYELDELNEMPNVITNVEFEETQADDCEDEYTYQIFVLGFDTRVKLLSVSGDDGNGYYGSGYYIKVKNLKK